MSKSLDTFKQAGNYIDSNGNIYFRKSLVSSLGDDTESKSYETLANLACGPYVCSIYTDTYDGNLVIPSTGDWDTNDSFGSGKYTITLVGTPWASQTPVGSFIDPCVENTKVLYGENNIGSASMQADSTTLNKPIGYNFTTVACRTGAAGASSEIMRSDLFYDIDIQLQGNSGTSSASLVHKLFMEELTSTGVELTAIVRDVTDGGDKLITLGTIPTDKSLSTNEWYALKVQYIPTISNDAVWNPSRSRWQLTVDYQWLVTLAYVNAAGDHVVTSTYEYNYAGIYYERTDSGNVQSITSEPDYTDPSARNATFWREPVSSGMQHQFATFVTTGLNLEDEINLESLWTRWARNKSGYVPPPECG